MNVEMNSVSGLPTMGNYFNFLPFNPVFIIIIVVVILAYVLLFSSLGKGADQSVSTEDGNGGNMLGVILASIFILLLIINGFTYLFNIDIITTIKNLFTNHPEIDINVNTPPGDSAVEDGEAGSDIPEITEYDQVYHIPGNNYTYRDSKALCTAFGGRLATIGEVQQAYSKGGEWCSYGWSDNQLALFPTQTKTWEDLQKVKGHENDCGRPGVNGGYIDNPNVRFGVNCYGHRPKITPLEAEIMENTPEYPITRKQQKFQHRVEYWKQRLEDILVSPFNRTTWSA